MQVAQLCANSSILMVIPSFRMVHHDGISKRIMKPVGSDGSSTITQTVPVCITPNFPAGWPNTQPFSDTLIVIDGRLFTGSITLGITRWGLGCKDGSLPLPPGRNHCRRISSPPICPCRYAWVPLPVRRRNCISPYPRKGCTNAPVNRRWRRSFYMYRP